MLLRFLVTSTILVSSAVIEHGILSDAFKGTPALQTIRTAVQWSFESLP